MKKTCTSAIAISGTLFLMETDRMWSKWAHQVPSQCSVTRKVAHHSPHTTHYSLSTCRGQTSKITHQVIILQTRNHSHLKGWHSTSPVVTKAKLCIEPGIRMTLHIKLSTSTLTRNFYQSLPFKGKPFVNCTGPAGLYKTWKTRDLTVQSKKCSHLPDLCVHFMTKGMMVSGCILRS